MNDFAKDVTIPTSFFGEFVSPIVDFFTDSSVLGMFVVAVGIAIIAVKLWQAIPKGVLVLVILFALLMLGFLKIG